MSLSITRRAKDNVNGFRLNFDAECDRLRVGFQNNIGNSGVKKTLLDVHSAFAIPDWQKSALFVVFILAYFVASVCITLACACDKLCVYVRVHTHALVPSTLICCFCILM